MNNNIFDIDPYEVFIYEKREKFVNTLIEKFNVTLKGYKGASYFYFKILEINFIYHYHCGIVYIDQKLYGNRERVLVYKNIDLIHITKAYNEKDYYYVDADDFFKLSF